MAIFPRKQNKKSETAQKKASSTPARTSRKARAATPALRARAATALISPWISEKAFIGTEKGVYVFSVSRAATKKDIMRAVETVYGIVPRKIRITNLPGKRVSSRRGGMSAIRARRRKAYVYLAKGDTIQFA